MKDLVSPDGKTRAWRQEEAIWRLQTTNTALGQQLDKWTKLTRTIWGLNRFLRVYLVPLSEFPKVHKLANLQ